MLNYAFKLKQYNNDTDYSKLQINSFIHVPYLNIKLNWEIDSEDDCCYFSLGALIGLNELHALHAFFVSIKNHIKSIKFNIWLICKLFSSIKIY